MSEKATLYTIQEFQEAPIGSEYIKEEFGSSVNLPYDFGKIVNYLSVKTITFNQCVFKEAFVLSSYDEGLVFEHCSFEGNIDFTDAKLDLDIQFFECTFHKKVTLENTNFNGNVEFLRTTFKEPITFFKTRFNKSVSFTQCTFEENALFTNTTCVGYFIIRSTNFKKGLDLSLTKISGTLSIFNIKLYDFKVYKGESYNDAIQSIEIPLVNKRETFRIIKRHLEQRQNIADSLHFKSLEKKTLLSETAYNLLNDNRGDLAWSRFLLNKTQNLVNLVLLYLNWLSNGFGLRLFQSFLFTIGIGALFYYLMLINTSVYYADWNWSWSIFKDNIPKYMEYLFPTHKINFMGTDFMLNNEIENGFYIFDLLGRIFISYGIYQTIQASRKFK